MLNNHFGNALRLMASAMAVGLMSGCGGSSNSNNSFKTPTAFTTIDGPVPGATTLNGISNTGTVVGFVTNAGVNSNFTRSFTGTIGQFGVGDSAAGMANGINISGVIVGVSNNGAFQIVSGTRTALTPTGSTASIAFGVNDLGAVVGQDTVGANTPGFLYSGGTFTTINPATSTVTNVQGINNVGQAIGFYSADGVHQHGFLYNVGTKQITLLPDPSTARITSGGLALTQFLGLNDHNEAVGYYQTNNGSQYGFLFNLSSQTYTYLDEPNAAPVSGVQVTQITGVDNAGEICGFYIDASGVQHGFTAI